MKDDDQKYSIARDGGWSSRKLWFCVFSVLAIIISSRIAPAASISEVITGICMVTGILISGNAITKWRAGGIEEARINAMAGSGPLGKIIDKVAAKVEANTAKIAANTVKIADEETAIGGPYVPPG